MNIVKGIIAIIISMFLVVGCASSGIQPMGDNIKNMTTTEQKAWGRISCRLIGQGVCAVKPEVAPPVHAVLDTVVSVNDVLSGDTSNAKDMKEWVTALKRSVELVKKKSFRNNVKDLLIILQERGMLDGNFEFIDLSELDTEDVDIDEIMSWIRECAGALNEGLEYCVEV